MAQVVVCGSINIDIVAGVREHPRPGETVNAVDLRYFPGGKGANQAVAAAKSDASVVMLGALGDDPFGPDLRAFLAESGVDVSRIVQRAGVASGTALILVDSRGENTIAVVPGANATVDDDVTSGFEVERGDVLVAQFETPVRLTTSFFELGASVGATHILNPAPASSLPDDLLGLVDVLVLNEIELASVTGSRVPDGPDDDGIVALMRELGGGGFGGSTIVTLGGRGAVALVGRDRVIRVPGHTVDVVDTTGAGDCFVGSLAAELSRGATIDAAMTYANQAAALCVQKPGASASMPARSDVLSGRVSALR